ncbi:hypothetical protein IWX46DRAFT_345793 [Phyllosticta citricarpa]|uniref:ATP synthase F0 subunit 8 n=1 Tax=Phyllosticta citricarpa TaxID=55181 RepID=A0ABR1MPT4_9PEZI
MAQADPLLFLFAWSIVLFSFLGYGMGWTGTDWTGLGWAGLSKRASKQSKAKQISDASSFIMSLTSSSSSVVIIGNIFPLRFSCFFSQSTPTSLRSYPPASSSSPSSSSSSPTSSSKCAFIPHRSSSARAVAMTLHPCPTPPSFSLPLALPPTRSLSLFLLVQRKQDAQINEIN